MFSSSCWKRGKMLNLNLETFFMLCIFIEIQGCENERISECLKILNTISRKKKLKKIGAFFYLKIPK